MSAADAPSSRTKHVPEWLNSPAWHNHTPHPLAYSALSIPSSNKDGDGNGNGEGRQASKDAASKTDDWETDQSNFATHQTANTTSIQDPLYVPHIPAFSRHVSEVLPSDSKESGEITARDVRVEAFASELRKSRIHIVELQRLASEGIPDSGGVRPITWKLLLGYLPKNREAWELEASKKRAEYAIFKEELLISPTEVARRGENGSGDSCLGRGLMQRQEITQNDHPLSLGVASIWNRFFQDLELVEQIERDVKRTHPDMDFFCGDSKFSLENQEAMKRALLIFAKLNPGIKYVQGMNEVLAPLYFVFKMDPDPRNMVHAEADAFFCFVELLSDVRDNFCKQLDNSAVGVRSTLAHLTALVRKHDEELWRHLDSVSKVNPQFYAFRWITLLLTQEFNFPNILRLWDSLLSNPDGPLEILLRVCCAMLICVRSHLLAGDFTDNLKLLQHYPSVDVHQILRVADELRDCA